ncbi:unnamed protein product [Brassica napus]|uniref:(rape) hypothetical protein n=1 Tax=Brassica napus TaxID=3708 RepID=A0A816MAA2_BRANA|nr:unnamed protein product [Brassica napus]
MAATFIVHFENGFIFIIICLFSFLCYYFFFKKPNDSQGCDLPPSPPSLPIIGHLHLLLSLLVHKSLHKLSSKYGPILYLRVLIVPILLVSSASIAYEIFRAQDMNVSTRNLPTNEGSLFFGSSGLATAPYGDYWKFIKSSSPQSSSDLRPSRGHEASARMRCLIKEVFLGGYLAQAAFEARDRSFQKDLVSISSRYNKVLEKSLVEYEEDHNQSCEMLDVLLEACQAEYKITRNHIKALFVDLFAANTDTSTNTIQWTMAKILERLREEIDSVVEKTRLIQETDLPNIPYLQAVVKEGLRLHPDRTFQEGCKIGGFDTLEKTKLVVNCYAVMTDPDVWEYPEEFKPERFLPSSRSYQEDEMKEEVLKYIPFRSGRRGCPGSNLAYLSVETAIGVMVQCFDWKIEGDEVNMEEARGTLTLTMAHPLKCTPLLRDLNLLPSICRFPVCASYTMSIYACHLLFMATWKE